jgi:hypothetical protein
MDAVPEAKVSLFVVDVEFESADQEQDGDIPIGRHFGAVVEVEEQGEHSRRILVEPELGSAIAAEPELGSAVEAAFDAVASSGEAAA